METLARHLSLALLALTIGLIPAEAQPADVGGTASFTVFLRGARVGSQSIEVSRTESGWLITSGGRIDPPVDLTTTRFEVAYSADWQPQRLTIEAQLRGEPFTLTTRFAGGTATSDITQGGATESRTVRVAPGTIVLPNSFFGAYQALAVRLDGMSAGTTLPVFAAPDTEVSAVIDRVSARHMVTPDGQVDVQDFVLTLAGPSGPVPLELWVDSHKRLARVVLPAAAIAVVRDDIASVMSREEPVRNPGDESLYIPANGFSLAATLTTPQTTAGKIGAVVLVASPGPQGREHMSYGVPVFGQLAGQLAAAGILVVRYDARGMGQTGGRTESAGVAEYAEDALAAVAWLRKRPGVDANRIVLVGYGEGGPIALAAAAREKNVKGVAVLAAPGANGRDVTLEQQELVLADLPISEASRRDKIALQTRVLDAVATGRGWESLPAELRHDFDTVWFRTWLLFSPSEVLKKVKQPILIAHGALDREVPPAHADRLESLAGGRKVPPTFTQKVIIPGLNHLLVPAQTGSVEEYPTLPSRVVSPEVAGAIVHWLAEVGAKR